MTVNTTWTDPSTKDKAVGATLPAADVNIISSGLNRLGGSDGNQKTGAYAYVVNALGSITGAQAVDLSTSGRITATLSGAVTFTLNNPVSGAAYRFEIQAAGYAITWPATVRWGDAGAPTLSGASTVDVIVLAWDGTRYLGAYSLGYSTA